MLRNVVALAPTIMMSLSSPRDIVFGPDDLPFGTVEWFVYTGLSCLLVIFAGIMSGLTLGLMSLGLVELEILQRSGTIVEKKQVSAILPVVKKQHQLLVTLLLCNACAMEALPISLDKIFHPFVAVLLSVTFVLAFGEIIPQAICSRYGLSVGASFMWLVRILMIICYPIAYPVGKAGKGGELTHDETTIISGALDLTEKTAEEAMTPIESTFSLDINSKLNWLKVFSLYELRWRLQSVLFQSGGFLAQMPLYDILNEFQKGSSHMAAVVKVKGKTKDLQFVDDGERFDNHKVTNRNSQLTDPLLTKQDSVLVNVEKSSAIKETMNTLQCFSEDTEDGEVIGIITLEDVFEELLQEEIVDETDVYVDVHKRICVAAAAAAVASSVARAPSDRRLIGQKPTGVQSKQGK
ncbi:hypothetical protein V6Z12_D08G056800 [Gossypium hirsutum]